MDESVINALRAAVEADPGNVALRLHFASVLQSGQRSGDALQHCAIILAAQPDNLETLKLAATAAESAGELIRAQGYRKVLEGLTWNSAKNLIESNAFHEPEPEPVQKSRNGSSRDMRTNRLPRRHGRLSGPR